MEKNNPTLEELLAAAEKAPDPTEDAFLNDVEQWIVENGIEAGDDAVLIRIAYSLYKEWSLAFYPRSKFIEIMDTKFKNDKQGYYYLKESSIEYARQQMLKRIGVRHYAQKKRRSKKSD